MSNDWHAAKQEIASYSRKMAEVGLVAGTSGNISVRLPTLHDSREIFAITPSGIPYEEMPASEIVVVDHDMETIEGELPPSSESLLHVAIYQARPDVGAIVHTHSVYTSVLAVAGLDLPPITDEVTIAVGGSVNVSEYGFPGSEDLANNVTDALGQKAAAIIRNHGAVGVGTDLSKAFEICALVERVAQIFVYASALGKVNPLPPHVVEAEKAIYNLKRSS